MAKGKQNKFADNRLQARVETITIQLECLFRDRTITQSQMLLAFRRIEDQVQKHISALIEKPENHNAPS
jgi:hypothetical protein